MKRLCQQNPHITAFEIQTESALTNHRVPSVNTIKRRLRNQYQLTFRLLEVKPDLIGSNDVSVCAFVENTNTGQLPIGDAFCFLTKPYSLTLARRGFVRREKGKRYDR